MSLTAAQLESYERDGFVLLPDYFTRAEVGLLREQLGAALAQDSERRVVEKDGRMVRSVYGSHVTNRVFWRLTRHPRAVGPAAQILGGDAYVYQFKINVKGAFGGDIWQWHQDFIFWHAEDGLPSPRITNFVLFLDEVSEFNGPLYFIPGSHREGVFDTRTRAERPEAYRGGPRWLSHLTASLDYALDRETVAKLVEKYGIASPKGPSGSALFFHSNLVHGSPSNISPRDRVVVIISFNSVENVPTRPSRPEFLVSRDASPIVPLADDALIALG